VLHTSNSRKCAYTAEEKVSLHKLARVPSAEVWPFWSSFDLEGASWSDLKQPGLQVTSNSEDSAGPGFSLLLSPPFSFFGDTVISRSSNVTALQQAEQGATKRNGFTSI